MRILMLGAGAMGSLLGARLSQTEANVVLFSTNREHMAAIRRNGLIIEELDGTIRHCSLPCYDDPQAIREKFDLVMVVVKSYATREAISSIRSCCHASTVFLTLQNGIGNWERIAGEVGREAVLVGITAQGATLVEAGRIRHGGNGPTYIGEPNGPASERVQSIIELFRKAGFEASASDQAEQLVWEKLHINVGINAITALTGIRNGFIAKFSEARELCRAAVEEAMQVARARGISIQENMVDRVLTVAEATAVNRSSMGQDVDRKKRTEIEAINGAIVQFAQEVGIPTPVNRTLTQLVKTLEANYRGES
jgi:2-dehydropantoate 2-reductase